MAVVVGAVPRVRVHRAQVLLLQLDQARFELLGVAEVARERVRLELELAADDVHQERDHVLGRAVRHT